MIASLPMYWRAENADLWRAFWAEVQRYTDVPALTPPEDIPDPWTDHWLRPDLALSMTCSLPFRTALREQVTYVGTLDFGVTERPGYYHSVLIARPGTDLSAPLTFARNSADSQSGWAAAFELNLTFSRIIDTGSHAASLQAVAEGRADAALLDAVTWRILNRVEPAAIAVEVMFETEPTPGLPLITSKSRDPAPLVAALRRACADFAPRDAALIGGCPEFVQLTTQDYLALPVPLD